MDEYSLMLLAFQQVGDILFSSSSEINKNNDIFELAVHFMSTKKSIIHTQNYVEIVIFHFDDGHLKYNFR